jgi:phosphopantothenoylcysteine decarboxylase/phosphopantothenate--cysteine ligase
MSLKGKKITVGITGGIAAYKIPSLIRLLKKDQADVQPIMTESAAKFITELTIETVSQQPVAREMFPSRRYVATHHIGLAEWPDLIVIAPATANFLGKAAAGVCDDLLTTVICATKSPVIISPSMNSNMYLNPVTQKNIKYLKSLGYIFIDPAVGDMACEEYGIGRMPEPDAIYKFILDFFEKKKLLKNKKVVVTAGPCREPVDPVRFISNRSSGKMGFALAEAAAEAGGEVTLIKGPVDLVVPSAIKPIHVETTDEMFKAVKQEFKNCHILIMAAAPADFRAASIEKKKIKKVEKGSWSLKLSPTVDILRSLKSIGRKGQKIIGFALETENALENAAAKLKDKGLELIVLNTVEESAPFDSDTNKVTLIYKNGKTESLPVMPKRELARLLIEKISRMK